MASSSSTATPKSFPESNRATASTSITAIACNVSSSSTTTPNSTPPRGLSYRAQAPNDLARFLYRLLDYPAMAFTIQAIYLDPTLDGPEYSGVLGMADGWEIRSQYVKQNSVRTAFKAAFDDLTVSKKLANVEGDDALPPRMYNDLITTLLAVCEKAEVVRI
jgi:hypothetical protein